MGEPFSENSKEFGLDLSLLWRRGSQHQSTTSAALRGICRGKASGINGIVYSKCISLRKSVGSCYPSSYWGGEGGEWLKVHISSIASNIPIILSPICIYVPYVFIRPAQKEKYWHFSVEKTWFHILAINCPQEGCCFGSLNILRKRVCPIPLCD